MLPVADFLGQLSEDEHRDLVNAVGAGLHDARLAAQCLTDPGQRHSGHVAQLLAYLSGAIRQLEEAREMVRRRA